MKRILTIIILLFSITILFSIEKNETSRYIIQNFGVTEGLPSDLINDIVQTNDGYLWLATTNGLVRFDGIKFEIIKINSIPSKNNIHVLFVDRNGILWAGGSSGLTKIKGDLIKSYSPTDGFYGKKITCITEDLEGNLWIGTLNNYLYCFKDNKFYLFNKKKGITTRSISSIFEDDHGDLWIGGFREGLFKKEKNRFKKIKLGEKYSKKISINFIYKKKDRILIGTSKGIFEFVDNKLNSLYSISNGLGSNDIVEMFEDNSKGLWVASSNGLTLIIDREITNPKIYNYLKYNTITSLFRDKEQNIWVGTKESGLKKLSEGVFESFPIKKGMSNNILSIYEDKNRHKWIGTPYGLFSNKKGEYQEFIIKKNILLNSKKPNWIRTIDEDMESNLWIGTASNGIIKINQIKVVDNFSVNNGLSSNNIFKIYCDKKNIIWIGTDKGLSSLKTGIIKNFFSKDGLSSNQIYHIFEDSQENLWVSGDLGINVFKSGNISSKSVKNYITGKSVSVVYEEVSNKKKKYLVGTFGSGLIILEQNNITKISKKKNGLPTNYIYQILKDKKRNYWISSNIGIIKIKNEYLDNFLLKKTNSLKNDLFGISHGMRSIRCSKYNTNSAIITKKGDIWFATTDGISTVSPSKLKINKLPPRVIIEEIIIDGVKQKKNKNLFMSPGCVHIGFTAPSFISPKNVQFKYKLKDYDKSWKTPRPYMGRTAHYLNLPPGKYFFKVIASNSDGVWNKKGASFSFIIDSYFYQSKFFWIWIILLSLILLFLLIYSIKKYLKYRKKLHKYKHSTLDTNKIGIYLEKLLDLIEKEKIYKDENISLQNLSKKIGIPPTHLSQIINDKLNKTFFDLINSYRIKEAKILLSENLKNGKSILEIAFDVGFNSQAAFYRAFKKNTGLSPSEFKKKYLE